MEMHNPVFRCQRIIDTYYFLLITLVFPRIKSNHALNGAKLMDIIQI